MKAEDKYDSLFAYYGSINNVDPLLLKAQVKQESQFDPMARSSAGACGLAQFVAATFIEWASKCHIASPNPYNPEHSIQCQAAYMRWLLDDFQNNMDRALGSYNFGVGNEMQHKPWPSETVNYVKHIKEYYEEYKNGALAA